MANARIVYSLLNEISRSELEYFIEQYVRDEDDRYMITRYYLDGIALQDIGEEMNPPMSRQAVSRRVHRQYKILMRHIRNIKGTL